MTGFLQRIVGSKMNATGVIRPRPHSLYESYASQVIHLPEEQKAGFRPGKSLDTEAQEPAQQLYQEDSLSTSRIHVNSYNASGYDRPPQEKKHLNTPDNNANPDTGEEMKPGKKTNIGDFSQETQSHHRILATGKRGEKCWQDGRVSSQPAVHVPRVILPTDDGFESSAAIQKEKPVLRKSPDEKVQQLDIHIPATTSDVYVPVNIVPENRVHDLPLPDRPRDQSISGRIPSEKSEFTGGFPVRADSSVKINPDPIPTVYSATPGSHGVPETNSRILPVILQPDRGGPTGDTIRPAIMTGRERMITSPRQEPPVIHVSIGRIEIRAVSQEPVSHPAPIKQSIPRTSLDDYLRSRGGGLS